ncbi:MAG: hypothetical protein LBN18_08685 [Dysgonamonadaceae bacterium]|jgi:hypothetical protein|nr:hypothetical protein [Dysgonamonadaceae bacterium]
MKKSTLSLLILLLFAACHKELPNRTAGEQSSFCYWDTFFRPDTALYRATGVNHFYVRYFDVDWDPVAEEARPVASLKTNDSIAFSFTPAVFFTNQVFEKSSKEQLQVLSGRIRKRVDEISGNFGYHACYRRGFEFNDSIRTLVIREFQNRYTEILIDCDWTATTRDKFFYFLNCLKKDFPNKNVTATLRLWQYKQQKPEDIPPVNRCLLMCYNMQTANDFRVENSIASMKELKKYVSGANYPLPLDVALPIFRWAVLFRNEQFVGLLGNADEKDYSDNFLEYEAMGEGRYRALTDQVAGRFFIRKGDILRIEGVSSGEIKEMVRYLKDEIPVDADARLTLFSWNPSYIQNQGTDEIQSIYSLFAR